MANLEDIIFNELETEVLEDVQIAEGVLPMNPILAYYTLKRNSLKNLKKLTNATAGKAKKDAKKTKAKVIQGREKLRSDLDFGGGKNPANTVYRLTRDQEEVLSKIHEKHGPEFIKELMDFRRNVLAPYQVIKRTVKKNRTLTSTETLGMTKEQFLSSLESGRRKIESRGSRFEKFDDIKEKIAKADRTVSALEQVKSGIGTNKRIPPSILERILKEYDLGKKEFESYSMSDLKKTFELIHSNMEDLGQLGTDDEMDTTKKAEKVHDIVKKNIELRKGKIAKDNTAARLAQKRAEDLGGTDLKEAYLYEYKLDLTKNKNFRVGGGGFNSALGLYYLRREIMQKLKPENRNSIYRETYKQIVDKLIADTKKRKKELSAKMVKNKTNTEFNDRERKIWELRPSVKTQSSELKDYVQKLKEEDFHNPKYFKKSDKLTDAEKKIEAGIKRFERSLKKRISPEEYAELKRYRLINNLITVGEMKSPDKLFKSEQELQDAIKSSKTPFISDSAFERKVRDIATSEYDSIGDLNKAKKEAEKLFADKEAQGEDDADVADKMKGILTQIQNRKTPKKKAIVGSEIEMTDDELIDAGVVEAEIDKMLKKDYSGKDSELKKDQIRLNKMVKKYKDAEGEEADRNLEEIDFKFKKLQRKISMSSDKDDKKFDDEDF